MLQAEKRYIEAPTPHSLKEWLEKQQIYKMTILKRTEGKRIFQKQNQFGERERVGRLLSLLIRTNSPPSTVTAVKLLSGEISSEP